MLLDEEGQLHLQYTGTRIIVIGYPMELMGVLCFVPKSRGYPDHLLEVSSVQDPQYVRIPELLLARDNHGLFSEVSSVVRHCIGLAQEVRQ